MTMKLRVMGYPMKQLALSVKFWLLGFGLHEERHGAESMGGPKGGGTNGLA